MNIFAYLRVSSKGQVDGDGFDRQLDKINSFCAKHGITVCSVYNEEGVSGTVEGMQRPMFAELLRRIEEKRASGRDVGAIVVERLDRLARDLMISELLLSECRKRGIKVFAADQGELIDMATNDTDPTRILIRQIIGALAQWEKSMLVAKLRGARERVKAKVGRCGGNKPFGSTVEEQATLKFIRYYYDLNKGNFSVSDMVQFLNGQGRTMRNGEPWNRVATATLVKRLLKRGQLL